MNPTTALWLILTMTVVSTAAVAPIAWEFRAEMKRAKARVDQHIALGYLSVLFGAATLGLWWYYATTTDQVMLAIIPTVSIVWGWLMRAAVNASRKAGA